MLRITVVLGVSLITSGILVTFCSSQNFDPSVNDKEYLDRIQRRLREEVMEAHEELVNQTKVLQQVTRAFIESKVKENLFKAVRARVEAELDEMPASNNNSNSNSNAAFFPSSPRQARQDDDDDDDSTTPRPTPPPRAGLLPQLANVVTTLFGSEVNVTNYIKDATSFLPADLSNRFVVAASLIDPARFTSTSTLPPLYINGQLISQEAILNGSSVGLPSYQPSFGGVQQGIVQQSVTSTQQQQKEQQTAFNPVGTISVSGAQVPQQQQAQQLPNAPQKSGSTPISPNLSSFGLPQTPALLPANPENQIRAQQPEQFGTSEINAQQQQQQQQQLQIQQQQLQLQEQQLQQQQLQQQLSNAGILPGTLNNGQFNYILPSQQQLLSPNGFLPVNGVPVTTNEIFNSVSLSGTTLRTTTKEPLNSNENEEEDSGEDELNGAESFIPKNPLDELEDSAETAADDLPSEYSSSSSSSDNNRTRPSTKQDKMEGYLDEIPAVQYAIKLFNRLTQTTPEIPTTTEFMNITTTFNSTDYEEEEVSAAAAVSSVSTSPPTTTVSRLYQGGVYIYAGAKEAYHLLQHLNKFLDRVNDRFENAGYGAEDIGVNVSDRKE